MCVLKDDFDWLLDKMLDADGIIFANPIFLASEKITANLKKTLDLFENPVDGIIVNINNMSEIIDNDKKMHDMFISLIALEIYDSIEVLRIACEKVFRDIEKYIFKN